MKKGFVIPLIYVVVVILAIGGVYIYQSNKVEAPVTVGDGFISGTAEQKRQALNELFVKVSNYNSTSIPKGEQTRIEEITPFIPDLIEAIMDTTSLPIENDKGWDVYHYSNSIMCLFAKRADGIQRCKDPNFSFPEDSTPVNRDGRKIVHDNWLRWWDEYKENLSNK